MKITLEDECGNTQVLNSIESMDVVLESNIQTYFVPCDGCGLVCLCKYTKLDEDNVDCNKCVDLAQFNRILNTDTVLARILKMYSTKTNHLLKFIKETLIDVHPSVDLYDTVLLNKLVEADKTLVAHIKEFYTGD